MGKLGSIEVADSTASHKSGAALLLDEPPSENELVQVDQDWEVELEEGNRYVVARTPQDLDADTVLSPAHGAIQKALDLLSFQNEGDFTCRDVDEERIIWWRDGPKQHIRTVNISGLGIATSATAVKTSGSGQQSTPPQPNWHESLRYFRLAQKTDDLFDAYRNIYLALEMILSHRDPQQSGEGERAWFERALKNAHNQFGLDKFAPNQQKVVDSIVQQQYYDTRVKLFHSKQGRSKLLPHNDKHRKHVQEALDNLSSMTVHIMKNTLNIQRNSGLMTNQGFDAMMSWIQDDQNIEARISDDDSPLDKSETLSSQPWQGSIGLSTSYSAKFSEPGLKCVLAEEPVPNIGQNTVRRIGLTNDQDNGFELFSSGRLEEDLKLDNIDQFEAHLGIELRNRNTVKKRFPS
jgi:hypothetical protein